jgi:hypothetical protein
MVDSNIVNIVKTYLAALPSFGIHPARAVLFGSFARGCPHEWSDIDLVVVAPEFDGPRDMSVIKSLWRATATDARIEPIPCGTEEWKTGNGRPILEIARQEGVEIAA